MADLASVLADDSRDTRGQLILVTAFALAAIFLGLALIVNSAIFTENLATRSENVESTEALEYRYGAVQFTGDVIEVANDLNHTSHDAIQENVSNGIADLGTYTSIQQVERGAGLSLTFESSTNGSRIFQADGGEFTNNESDGNWELVDGVSNTRAFELDLTDDEGPFTIVVKGAAGSEWSMTVDNSELTVERSGFDESCGFDSIETIDITGGTVNGHACPALEDTDAGDPMHFAAGVDEPYSIEFEGGETVEGTYRLVVDNDSTATIASQDDYADIDGPGTGPSVTPAMYSAMLSLDYETARVVYQTELRVAPGEPR